MTSASSVGRVGGLAAALGVGLALSAGCGLAWADTADRTSSSDAAPSSAPAGQSARGADATVKRRTVPTPSSSATEPTPESTAGPATDPAPATVRPRTSPRAPQTAAAASRPVAGSKNRAVAPVAPLPAGAADPTPAPDPIGPQQSSISVLSVPTTPVLAAPRAARSVAVVAPAAATALTAPAPVLTDPVPAAQPAPASPVAKAVTGVINGLLAAFGMSPLAANSPLAPAEQPALWGLLAWTRKQFEKSIPAAGVVASTPTVATGTALAAAAVPLAAAAVASPTTTTVAWLTGRGSTGPYLLKRTNNTSAMFGIAGTDVGIMWDNGIADNPATAVNEHQVLIAFGDTFSGLNMTGTWRSNVLLRSSDANLADGITVAPGVLGKIFSGSPLSGANLSKQIIKSPGYIGWGGSEVTLIPTAGISLPYKNTLGARQYISYMSVKSWDTPGRWTTNYAGIAYSDDNGQNWTVAPSSIRSAANSRTTTAYVSGNQNFQQSAFLRAPAGSADANYVYMYGTPSGRSGTVYLSRVAQTAVLDQTKYEYWNGTGWVLNKPSVATPVLPGSVTPAFSFFGLNFGGTKTYPSAGEMSVQYNTYLKKYVMMYTDSGNNVVMRTADNPQGAWSGPTTVVTSLQYPGLYAPMMNPWSTGQDIYWNMSMWGDYNVLLMHTRLV